MDQLIVRTAEDSMFLDRVVAHGVRYEMLTLQRRQEIVQRIAVLHRDFCARVGLNAMVMKEALDGAKLLHQVLSVALEIVSKQNIEAAALILSSGNIESTYEAAERRMDKALRRLDQYGIDHFGSYDQDLPSGCSTVGIEFSREVSLIAHISGLRWQNIEDLTHLLYLKEEAGSRRKSRQAISSLDDLVQLEFLLNQAEEECRISKKYLPWKKLVSMASLSPRYERSSRVANVTNWGIVSLLSTLSISLRLEGKDRGKPLISLSEFQRFSDQMTTAQFKDGSLRLAEEYLRSQKPKPSDYEVGVLIRLWSWSIDRFLEAISGGSKIGILHEFVQLEIESIDMNRELVFADLDRNVQESGKYTLQELFSLAERVNDDTEAFQQALSNFDWGSLKDQTGQCVSFDLHELVTLAPPAAVVEHLPLELCFVSSIVADNHWEEWSKTEKRSFIEKLLKHWKEKDWLAADMEFIKAILAEAGREQVKAIKSKRWYKQHLRLIAAERKKELEQERKEMGIVSGPSKKRSGKKPNRKK